MTRKLTAGRMRERHEACPNKAKHTSSPEGYLAWHEWAQQMMRTHRSMKCPTCGLYAIWIPKTAGKETSDE